MPKVTLGALIALLLTGCAPMPVPHVPEPQAIEIAVPTFTEQDVNYLATTIWAEARGEGREGMELVASVIKNRVESGKPRRYGDGFKGVVTRPWQFSCWNVGDPNSAKCRALVAGGTVKMEPGDRRAYDVARQIAIATLSGALPDRTKGACHYHTDRVNPSWNRSMRLVAQVGRHKFFTDDL